MADNTGSAVLPELGKSDADSGSLLTQRARELNSRVLGTDRLKLWIMDPKLYPPTHYLRAVPLRYVHWYTGVQLVCLTVLWLVKASAIGILFPFFVAMLVPVRMALKKPFWPHHLALLDAEEGPADEEFREVGA